MLSRTKRKKSIKNLKKFKKAKFNYAKFVKKYYIEKAKHIFLQRLILLMILSQSILLKIMNGLIQNLQVILKKVLTIFLLRKVLLLKFVVVIFLKKKKT